MISSDARDFYSLNIEVLHNKYPGFKNDIISKYSPANDIAVSETADGLASARIDNIWIHSSRQPEKEARRLAESGLKWKYGLCLIYGFGLGYHVEAVRKYYPELEILVIEPEPGIFLKALELRDFTELFSSDKVGLLLDTPPGVLSGILSRHQTSRIQTIKLRSVLNRNIEYFTAVDQKVQTFLRKRETNMNTLNRFGRTWTRNLFRNIEVFSEARDCGILFGQFTEFPALVLAAGPSLDLIGPLLPKLVRKAVLICVDTSLRAVLSYGVVPDFIAVVDPQYLNTRHLDHLLDSLPVAEHSVLISESSTHPAVFRDIRIPVLFYKSFFPLGRVIERHAGIKSQIGAGGSVSTTAWDFAKRLGCREIYTGGLDLGFPCQNTHCRTSLSSLYTAAGTEKLNPIETINFRNVRSADPYPVPNNCGGETLTDKRLEIYKWWFEGQMDEADNRSYYNVSEFGIRINGMEYRSVEELLKKPDTGAAKRRIITEILAENKRTDENDFKSIGKIIQAVIDECRRLEEVCSSALAILESVKISDSDAISAYLDELSLLDNKISESPSKDITGFIIQPVLNEIIDNDDNVIRNSELLYTNMLEACRFNRIHAERAAARMA